MEEQREGARARKIRGTVATWRNESSGRESEGEGKHARAQGRMGQGRMTFCGILLIFAPQRDGQTDPLEAPPWTPGVLAHLVPSYGTHTAQKVESLRYIMARTAIRTDVGPPLPGPAAAPSGRPRLHGPPPASVIVPTPMPTAHGVDPTVYIASWSLVDGTPD